jgi:hypothetical protein
MELVLGIISLIALICFFSLFFAVSRIDRALKALLVQQQRIFVNSNYTNRLLEEMLVRSTGKPMLKGSPTQDEIMVDLGIVFNGQSYSIKGAGECRSVEEAIDIARRRSLEEIFLRFRIKEWRGKYIFGTNKYETPEQAIKAAKTQEELFADLRIKRWKGKYIYKTEKFNTPEEAIRAAKQDGA